MKRFVLFIFMSCCSCLVFGQQIIVDDIQKIKNEDPLRPAKAAFYSAVLPGLGQAYNKRYWKIPLVYGAIGASIYTYKITKTICDIGMLTKEESLDITTMNFKTSSQVQTAY